MVESEGSKEVIWFILLFLNSLANHQSLVHSDHPNIELCPCTVDMCAGYTEGIHDLVSALDIRSLDKSSVSVWLQCTGGTGWKDRWDWGRQIGNKRAFQAGGP